MINVSLKKCVVCNNKKSGEFIVINTKKYHLCCIEQQQHNWNELKKWLEEKDNNGYEKVYVEDLLYKIQELEQGKDE